MNSQSATYDAAPSRDLTIAGRPSRKISLPWVPYLYLAITLPVAMLLCFLVPPMQTTDDGRHFLRACQIAQGQVLPQVNSTATTAGGFLPAAAVEFVRDKMNPEFFRQEDQLRTLGERLRALDRAAQNQPPLAQKEFGVFPGSAIYAPALYLPQAAAIRVARLFSHKVYVWFYSARVVNAVISILLIFVALRLAPAYQLILLIPAILPMSLYQISSLSCDAGIIAVSILFVSLCLVFLQSDGVALRITLVLCLLFLTLAKPVYLPFALLLVPAYKRMGWRRALSFFAIAVIAAAAAYIGWSYFIGPILPMSSGDFPGRNPSFQFRFVLAHPLHVAAILLDTLKHDFGSLFPELTGIFGWVALPLPSWFYKAAHGFFAAILLLILLPWRRWDASKFVCGIVAAAASSICVFLALFILATPVGSPRIVGVQGRYFIPVLAILPFFIPPWAWLGRFFKIALPVLVLGFFVLSAVTTVRIVKHYYFPQSDLLGRDVGQVFIQVSDGSCPASPKSIDSYGFFSTTVTGRANVAGKFSVMIANENGTILGVSDPVLAGADFPFNVLPGSSRSDWRVHIWDPNRYATLHYWLIRGKTACIFGPELILKPYHVPQA